MKFFFRNKMQQTENYESVERPIKQRLKVLRNAQKNGVLMPFVRFLNFLRKIYNFQNSQIVL